MNTRQTVIATAATILLALACGDVPVGGDKGDSAGNNQPGGAACNVGTAYQQQGEPAARFDDGKFVYDLYLELWDDGCEVAAMEGGGREKPLNVFIDGNITDSNGVSQPADFLGGSQHQKDVDSPYHLRAFVAPRNAPHDVQIIGRVNRAARAWVQETLPDGFLHCRITRDGAPIHPPRGSGDRVTHTVPISSNGQVVCHVTVGVG